MESARNLVLTSAPWSETGCTVEISSTPPDMTIYHDGQIEVEAVLDRYPSSLRDISAVTVEVYVGGTIYMRFDPSPYLDVSVPVYRFVNDLDRDDIVTEDDIEEVMVDVRELPLGDLVTDIDEIVGLAARMNLQAGRIVTDGLLEPPTLVFRGESVLVIIPLGEITITLNGTALDSGALGEEIRVRNPDSRAIITAIVTGPSRAEINLSG